MSCTKATLTQQSRYPTSLIPARIDSVKYFLFDLEAKVVLALRSVLDPFRGEL